MASTQLDQPLPKQSPHLSDDKRVIAGVLAQLGRPENLYRISAERLWGEQFRVNVWCSEESDRPVKTVRMTDSFFVTLTDEGVESTPPIVKKYE